MSTKDLIERLTQKGGKSPQRSSSASPSGSTQEVQTRVNNGVIRRRRVGDEPVSAPAPLPPPPSRPSTSAPAVEIRTDSTVIRRRIGAPPVERRAPEPEPIAELPAQEFEAQLEPAPVAYEPEPEPVVVEHEVEAPEPEPEPVAAEPVDTTPEPAQVHVAPEPEPEPEPVQVAPEPEPVQVAPEPERKPAPVAPAAPPAPVAAPTPPAAPHAQDNRPAPPRAHATLASGLPRADGGAARNARLGQNPDPVPRVPGLGKAVVRPPPGYDPNDPMAYRRRAPEPPPQAPQRPQPPQQQQAQQPQERWGPGGPNAPQGQPPADGGGDADARRRNQRNKPPARRGRVEMSVEEIGGARRARKGGKGKLQPAVAPTPQAKAIKRRVEVDGSITVANLAHAMSVKSSQVIKVLMSMGRMATVNEALDLDSASLVATEFDYEVVNSSFQETDHFIKVEETDENVITRPPVVTIMGHVDHGKTTLLDAIRKAKVAAGEAGGITQHIGAYQVERKGQRITFIDTPGHEAFTSMRARGARVTDIVVLVVAADDGVMPQTVEAINHAKAAGVAIMVAVNKIDKPGANPLRVRQALMEHHLVPEEYGGDTMYADVSALKGKGIDDLLDNILLVAEVADYKANPERHAEGTVLEARLERGRGPVASLLVQKGTLKIGDNVVIGTTWGRIRMLNDYAGRRLKQAGPSTPVEVAGLEGVPLAGDDFTVVSNEKDAKTLAEHRAEQLRAASMVVPARMTLEDLLARRTEDEKIVLNLIIKADVGGSMEAIKHAFGKIAVKGTDLKVLHAGVGAVTESDVTLAHTYKAVVIGFNVRPDAKARQAADQNGVEIRTYNVIYEAIEDVEKALKGLLSPTFQEKLQGTAQVLKTFQVPKVGMIAGCLVGEGKVVRANSVRLIRDGKIVWTGRLSSLKRFKDDVREVEKGYECGMGLDGYNDLKVGDIIESFSQEEVVQA